DVLDLLADHNLRIAQAAVVEQTADVSTDELDQHFGGQAADLDLHLIAQIGLQPGGRLLHLLSEQQGGRRLAHYDTAARASSASIQAASAASRSLWVLARARVRPS